MSEMPSAWPITNTEHGRLVAFGDSLQGPGLLDRLRQVPIAQKTRALAPQAKLAEWLAGIMSGMEHWHASRLNHGPRPRARGPVVARVWALARFAHYSSASRALHACDARTAAAVEEAATTPSKPATKTRRASSSCTFGLLSHPPAGIRLRFAFTGLAANVVRWCRPWLKDCASAPMPRLARVLNGPEHVVRVAANAAALVHQTDEGTVVLCGPRSALPGAAFTLRGVPANHPPLGFHQPCKIATESTKGRLVAQNLR